MEKFFMFVLGVAAGSLLTYKFVEEKYKKIANEEIEAIREYYRLKYDYKEMVNDLGYSKKENTPNTESIDDVESTNENDENDEKYIIHTEEDTKEYVKPYVINESEFGEKEGYNTVSCMYWDDDILTDNDGTIITDPARYIGDGLNHLGESESTLYGVYIRNENIKCDYEIIKSEKTYDEGCNWS